MSLSAAAGVSVRGRPGAGSSDAMSDKPQKMPRCSICGAPASQETRPFCSRRCRDVDLARWLSGSYAIAGGRSDEEADDARAGGPVLPDGDSDNEPD